MMRKRSFRTYEEVCDWHRAYNEMGSMAKTAKAFGISTTMISHWFKKYGLRINRPGKNKKYSVNDNFFSVDAPEAFYWAGFIAADGWVTIKTENSKFLGLSLAAKDYEHLRKFKAAIGHTGPILDIKKIDDGKIYYGKSLKIFSCKIVNDLVEKFSIIPKKSLVYDLPKKIYNHKYINHFLRGYFDGDGCWYYTRPKKEGFVREMHFDLTGGPVFLKTFMEILISNNIAGRVKLTHKKDSNVYHLKYGGNVQTKKIRDFLYNGSCNNIEIERKRNIIFSDWFEQHIPHKRHSIIGSNILTEKQLFFISISEAKKHGFNCGNISKCCRGKQKTHRGFTFRYATPEEIKKYAGK